MPDSRETPIPLNADHVSICRFACEDDEEYKHVSALIVDLARSATQICRELPPQEAFAGTTAAPVKSRLVPGKGFCKLFEMGAFRGLLNSVLDSYGTIFAESWLR